MVKLFVKQIALNDIADKLHLNTHKSNNLPIYGVSSLELATKEMISYIQDDKYIEQAIQSQAGALIVRPSIVDRFDCPLLISKNPEIDMIKVANLFISKKSTAENSKNTSIAKEAKIGSNVSIGPGTIIGSEVVIGNDCTIGSNVSLAYCSVGDRCFIGSGSVFGTDGFGFKYDGDKWLKVPHFGDIRIENDCYFSSMVHIDRGTYGSSHISKGVKMDSMIHIGHNVDIGEHSLFAGSCAVAGSVKIGKRCTFGGASRISSHVTICDDSNFMFGSVISRDIKIKGDYSSTLPVLERSKWNRLLSYLYRKKI